MTHSSLWKLPELLDEFLVDQLLQNRLAIVLGAGVSHGAKLPNWETLVYRLYKQEEEAPPEGRTPEEASEDFLLKHCGNDEHELAKRVHVALYENADLTSPALASDKMLNALGAIMTSSGRGSAAYAVSFNYDDLLECHLRYRGFVVDSVHSLPNWSNSADMIIYHAHGYLPSNPGEGISKGIVLTAQSYDNVIGNEKQLWEQKIRDIFRSHTCIFIGLSGKDIRLRSTLNNVQENHVSRADGNPFWGVHTMSRNNDIDKKQEDTWTKRGIVARKFDSYDEIPGWLFELCRLAAVKRMEQH